MNLAFMYRVFRTLRILAFGEQKIQDWYRSMKRIVKKTVWYAIHSEVVGNPYYFDNAIVRTASYCELLDTYMRNESKNFLANALSQKDGALLHNS